MSGKDQILSSLRRSKGRDGPVDAETVAALRARIVSAEDDGAALVLASHADWERLARHPPPAPPRLVVEAT